MSKEQALQFIENLELKEVLEFDEEDRLYPVCNEFKLYCDGLPIWAIQLTHENIILIDFDGSQCQYPYDEFKKEEYACYHKFEI